MESKISPKLGYFYAVGRRKTAVARVRFFDKAEPAFIVNAQPIEKYFPAGKMKEVAMSPLTVTGHEKRGKIEVKVSGGGKGAQAESIRHGVARVLIKFDKDLRKTLKSFGFLRRDPRVKERKKPGLKKARRAPQWQKR